MKEQHRTGSYYNKIFQKEIGLCKKIIDLVRFKNTNPTEKQIIDYYYTNLPDVMHNIKKFVMDNHLYDITEKSLNEVSLHFLTKWFVKELTHCDLTLKDIQDLLKDLPSDFF